MMIPTLHEQILTEIKRCNAINKYVWSKKLVDILDSPRDDIMRVIDTLIEFGMVIGKWSGAYNKDNVVHYTYYITDIGDDHLNRLKQLNDCVMSDSIETIINDITS